MRNLIRQPSHLPSTLKRYTHHHAPIRGGKKALCHTKKSTTPNPKSPATAAADSENPTDNSSSPGTQDGQASASTPKAGHTPETPNTSPSTKPNSTSSSKP